MAIQSVAVKLLRPTQIAVGKRLVKLKRKGLRAFERKPLELVDFILAHPIRVVIGPDSEAFIIDHHHLGCALLKEEFVTAPVKVEDDLSRLSVADFWGELERRSWVHPLDGQGMARPTSEIPASLEGMDDDPYRSLAGFVRMAGGFRKTDAPYVEFLWADYFRPLVQRKLLDADFEKIVKQAVGLAVQPDASHLPGFLGEAGAPRVQSRSTGRER
jgi:hypothetical protein